MTEIDDIEYDSADFDGPDETAMHAFQPKRLESGDATLVCRRCTGWYDAPQHAAVA